MKPGFHRAEPEVEERRQRIAAAYEDALEIIRTTTSAVLRRIAEDSASRRWMDLYNRVGSDWSKYVVEERRRRLLC